MELENATITSTKLEWIAPTVTIYHLTDILFVPFGFGPDAGFAGSS